ncbi:unnamed protein product [Bursaphelenchus okinawaensis]|uniref:HTH CENPB-type domain-containing protein n=1 Tax=Bursaphelenchus okinawaensis TaxID=465554 RepID=A0A811JS75_9BILA|nr:unnamed protein product [Bursaphelenchus okinawaensis]CAG9080173.1 unnamed protein product [Bursaphelenchus okinawaensis]
MTCTPMEATSDTESDLPAHYHHVVHKRRSISMAQKKDIVQKYREGRPLNEIRKEYNLPRSTMLCIIKKSEEILQAANPCSFRKKRIVKVRYEVMEKEVYKYYKMCIDRGLPINGDDIRNHAKQVAEQIGEHEFKASMGWLGGFKKRHGISLRSKPGEIEFKEDSEAPESSEATDSDSLSAELLQLQKQITELIKNSGGKDCEAFGTVGNEGSDDVGEEDGAIEGEGSEDVGSEDSGYLKNDSQGCEDEGNIKDYEGVRNDGLDSVDVAGLEVASGEVQNNDVNLQKVKTEGINYEDIDNGIKSSNKATDSSEGSKSDATVSARASKSEASDLAHGSKIGATNRAEGSKIGATSSSDSMEILRRYVDIDPAVTSKLLRTFLSNRYIKTNDKNDDKPKNATITPTLRLRKKKTSFYQKANKLRMLQEAKKAKLLQKQKLGIVNETRSNVEAQQQVVTQEPIDDKTALQEVIQNVKSTQSTSESKHVAEVLESSSIVVQSVEIPEASNTLEACVNPNGLTQHLENNLAQEQVVIDSEQEGTDEVIKALDVIDRYVQKSNDEGLLQLTKKFSEKLNQHLLMKILFGSK